MVKQATDAMDILERRACWVLQLPRSTQRYQKEIPEDEDPLRTKVIELRKYDVAESISFRVKIREGRGYEESNHSSIMYFTS